MAIHLVTFATPAFYASQRRLERSARKFGVSVVHSYNFETIKKSPFYDQYRQILDLPRGAGYWLWKPYIILETLKQLRQEDVLLYLDSDFIVVGDLIPFCDLCTVYDPIVLVTDHGHRNSEMTRRDCFYYMECDDERYSRAEQVTAGCQLYKKTARSLSFVGKYLELCCDQRLLLDGPNHCGLPNLDGFIDHRHDQSVLSLLAEKKDVKRVRNPAQWGNHLKMEQYRVPGEWLPGPYSDVACANSTYGTLLDAKSPGAVSFQSRVAAGAMRLISFVKNLKVASPWL